MKKEFIAFVSNFNNIHYIYNTQKNLIAHVKPQNPVITAIRLNAVSLYLLVMAILLTWINLNPSMDK